MAKLTDEQKEANKAERRILESNYKVARKAYEADLERSRSEFNATPLKSQMEAANAAWDKGFVAYDQEEKAIRVQIAVLEQQIKDLPGKHNREQLNQARTSTNDAFYKGLREVEKQVDARHPHVAGVYSASHWAENVRKAQAPDEDAPEHNSTERMRSS